MNQIREKASFNLSTLKTLVETPNSCVFCEKECQRTVFLLPIHLADLKQSVKDVLDTKVTIYDIDLKGIILAFKNVKVKHSVKFIDNGNFRLDYVADIYVFKPSIGSVLSGTIIKKSRDVLGCLVHKIFNVAISCPRKKELYDAIKVGQTVNFNVVKLDYTSNLPYIKGELISIVENGDGPQESPNDETSHQKNNSNRKHKLSENEIDTSLSKRPKFENSEDVSSEASPLKAKKKKKKKKENTEEADQNEDIAAKLLSQVENSLKTKKKENSKGADQNEDLAAKLLSQAENSLKTKKDENSTSDLETSKKKKKKKKSKENVPNDLMAQLLSDAENSIQKKKPEKLPDAETSIKKKPMTETSQKATNSIEDLQSQLISDAEVSLKKKKKKKDIENLASSTRISSDFESSLSSKKKVQTKIEDFAKPQEDLVENLIKKKKKHTENDPEDLRAQLLSQAEASFNVPKIEKKKKKKDKKEDSVIKSLAESEAPEENYESNLLTLAEVATSPNAKQNQSLSKKKKKFDSSEIESKKRKNSMSPEDLASRLLSEAQASLNGSPKKKKVKLETSVEDLTAQLLSEAEASLKKKKKKNKKDSVV